MAQSIFPATESLDEGRINGLRRGLQFLSGQEPGACGEGGAVTTNDGDIARQIRMLRDHGQAKKYYHEVEGYNGRLDAIQAGILRVKLPFLASWNERRRECALRYQRLLGAIAEGIEIPFEPGMVQGGIPPLCCPD